jgi:hypothetical protein
MTCTAVTGKNSRHSSSIRNILENEEDRFQYRSFYVMIVGRNNVIEQEDETMPVGVVVTLGVFGFMVLIAVIIAAVSAVASVTGIDHPNPED